MDTGTRLREATGLQWADVDLVPEDASGSDGRRSSVRLMTTKSNRPRGVPLPRRADELLRRLYRERPPGQDRVFLIHTAGSAWRGTERQAKLFASSYGAWRAAVGRAGLTDVRLHDLRHTYASRLVQRGVPLYTVSQLLGHASLKMTLRYSHLATRDLETAVAKLD